MVPGLGHLTLQLITAIILPANKHNIPHHVMHYIKLHITTYKRHNSCYLLSCLVMKYYHNLNSLVSKYGFLSYAWVYLVLWPNKIACLAMEPGAFGHRSGQYQVVLVFWSYLRYPYFKSMAWPHPVLHPCKKLTFFRLYSSNLSVVIFCDYISCVLDILYE